MGGRALSVWSEITLTAEETMPSTTRNIHFGNETTITTEQTESERNETTLVALSSLVDPRRAIR